MPSRGGFTVSLHRDNPRYPWGIRLVGGCDLGKPIVITKVGSPADRMVKPGDVIQQIEDYDARDLRHEDAQMLFKNAGNSIRLVVQRESTSTLTPGSSRCSSVDPLGLPHGRPASVAGLQQTDYSGPTLINPAILLSQDRETAVVSPHRQEVEDEIHAVVDQPYRTTPLVLPGAKVKKDALPTQSYLRHHPNPMFRQAPPHPLLSDIAMKHKMADTVLQKVEEELGPGKQVVHKQFNSPIGLYSEQNIVDTINAQAGLPNNPSPTLPRSNTKLSYKKTVVYDPSKSETYKALQDEELGDIQEVVPVQPKVFAPTKKAPPPHSRSVPHPVPGPQGHHINSIGTSAEEIQQSHTFKRLMHMVQSEGAY